MVKGSPSPTQLNHVIGKQIFISFQRTYTERLALVEPNRRAGKTTWARAVFEDYLSVTAEPSYNLWEKLPRHPLSVCRASKPLSVELVKYNRVRLPNRNTAHPADRFISSASPLFHFCYIP